MQTDRYIDRRPPLPGETHNEWLVRTRCNTKIRYSTQKSAERDLKRVVRKFGNQGKQVYDCPLCNRYHIGGRAAKPT